MKWHEKKEKQEVDSPLRLILFMGLLEHWKIRLRALEADESLRNLMVEKGLATVKEGIPELQWGYQCWNPDLEKLEPVPEAEPMLQSQVVDTLVQLEATIAALNVLVQFHATRKLVESLEGDTITFLMGVGLRDPMASQAWGMMTNLCGLSAGRLIGLRVRRARMERQEKFPPPKGKGKGKGRGRGRPQRGRQQGLASLLVFGFLTTATFAISMLLATCFTGCSRFMVLIMLSALYSLPCRDCPIEEDASEFVAFLFGVTLPAAYVGRWEARSCVGEPAGEILTLRCFSNAVDTSFYIFQYRVVGLVYHIGLDLKAGHYKAALRGAVRNSSRLAYYIADDARPIAKATSVPIEVQEGGYLVGRQLL
ncbi:unnamed protein product [Symbiodinium microadriaticum]|nr:unnamed protein product [Symbiodinium microadriaticum]